MMLDLDANGPEMTWILLKFLKDSLEFLCENKDAMNTKRMDWAKRWQRENLNRDAIDDWMPKTDE